MWLLKRNMGTLLWYMDKNPPANAEGTGLNPSPGRFHVLQGNKARVPHY